MVSSAKASTASPKIRSTEEEDLLLRSKNKDPDLSMNSLMDSSDAERTSKDQEGFPKPVQDSNALGRVLTPATDVEMNPSLDSTDTAMKHKDKKKLAQESRMECSWKSLESGQ